MARLLEKLKYMVSSHDRDGQAENRQEDYQHDGDRDPRHIIPGGVIAKVTAIEIDLEVFTDLPLDRLVEVLFGVGTG